MSYGLICLNGLGNISFNSTTDALQKLYIQGSGVSTTQGPGWDPIGPRPPGNNAAGYFDIICDTSSKVLYGYYTATSGVPYPHSISGLVQYSKLADRFRIHNNHIGYTMVIQYKVYSV